MIYYCLFSSNQIGTTNMVRLKPEDFTSSVVKLHVDKNDKGKPLSTIREIKRILNEDPQNTGEFILYIYIYIPL